MSEFMEITFTYFRNNHSFLNNSANSILKIMITIIKAIKNPKLAILIMIIYALKMFNKHIHAKMLIGITATIRV